MTAGGSFLNGSIRNLNNGRGHPYGSKKKEKSKNVDSRLKISGMTWEGVDASLNFRHDGKETSPLNGSTRGP